MNSTQQSNPTVVTQQKNTVKLAKMGMLVAISIVLVTFIRIPMLGAAHMEYDPADIPILIGAFAFGPLGGLMLTIVTSVIQGLTVSAASGPIGIAMHIVATGTYVLVAGNIYKRNKTRKSAAIALVAGGLSMVAIMIPFNLIFTPMFIPGVTVSQVIPMLAFTIVPFNLIKAGLNGIIVFILYKRISAFLHR